jgi:hypothetical protein
MKTKLYLLLVGTALLSLLVVGCGSSAGHTDRNGLREGDNPAGDNGVAPTENAEDMEEACPAHGQAVATYQLSLADVTATVRLAPRPDHDGMMEGMMGGMDQNRTAEHHDNDEDGAEPDDEDGADMHGQDGMDMHGADGMDMDEGTHHVWVSLADANTGAVVTDAALTLEVTAPGGEVQQETLERMGNWFGGHLNLLAAGDYLLTLRLTRGGVDSVDSFEYTVPAGQP